MSCNPAMGGLGKGHLIREIDAMGGVMGLASDSSGIQFRMLNRTRGEAVQGPRAQIDRNNYKSSISNIISNEGIDIIEDEVIDILINSSGNKKTIKGIETESNWKNYLWCCYINNRYFSIRKNIYGTGNLECGKNWRCLLQKTC